MARFIADGFRAVEADTHQEAATVFATRAARRAYGRNGLLRTLRADSWTDDGRHCAFQAYIGRPVPGDPQTTSGHNVWIHTYLKGKAEA